jgi:hypothetical protein
MFLDRSEGITPQGLTAQFGEITLDRNVVADVQARVRRSPLPPTGP